MRVGVREGTKAIVVFLASSIPEGQLNVLAVDFDIGDVVLKYGGYIDLKQIRQSFIFSVAFPIGQIVRHRPETSPSLICIQQRIWRNDGRR